MEEVEASALTVVWAGTCVGCTWLPIPGGVTRPQLEPWYHGSNNHPCRKNTWARNFQLDLVNGNVYKIYFVLFPFYELGMTFLRVH